MSLSGQEVKEDDDSRLSFKDKLLKMQTLSKNRPTCNLVHVPGVKENILSNETSRKETEDIKPEQCESVYSLHSSDSYDEHMRTTRIDVPSRLSSIKQNGGIDLLQFSKSFQPNQCESVSSLHSSDSDDEHMRTQRTRNDVPSRLSTIIRNGGIRMFPPSQERVPATYTAESPEEPEYAQPNQCESVSSLHSSDSVDEHMRTHRTRIDVPSRLSSIIRNDGIRMFPPSQERVPVTYTAESLEEPEYVQQNQYESVSSLHSSDSDDEHMRTQRTRNDVPSRLSSIIRNGGIRMFPPSQERVPATYTAESPEEPEYVQPNQCESISSLHSSDSDDEHMRTQRTRNDVPSRLSSIIRNGGIRMFPPSQERVPATYTAESLEEPEYVQPNQCESVSSLHSSDSVDEHMRTQRTRNDVPSRLSSIIRNGGIRMFPPSQERVPATYTAKSLEEPEYAEPISPTYSMNKHEAEIRRKAPLLPPIAPKPSPRNFGFSFTSASKPTVDMPSEVMDDIHASNTFDLQHFTIGAESGGAEIVPSAPQQPKDWSCDNSPVMSRDDFLTEEELCFIYEVNHVSEIPSEPEDSAQTVVSIAQENDRLKEERLCKICLDKTVAIAFIPCGHAAACEECAKQLMQCALCRANITGRLRIYI